jgi:hypothetical protein
MKGRSWSDVDVEKELVTPARLFQHSSFAL